MLNKLQETIGTYKRMDINTTGANGPIDFTDPEVIFEFIDHEVVLPIVAYDGETESVWLEFHHNRFQVCAAKKPPNMHDAHEFHPEVIETYLPTQFPNAVHGLQEVVEKRLVPTS